MEKKYQFFISSTYEDLKEERNKAIQAILTMNQFPIGMEMFSAADDDQWKIIKEAIDSSDFYILILGNRYGSIEETTGISYTEKEFDYAVEKKIPVLAFIVDSSVNMTADKFETDPQKIAKLNVFKEKVKQSGRYVKFWKNVDNLETLISQSISKAVIRGNRPGWVRTTDFDIDKSYAEILRLTERVHTLEALNSDLRIENNRKPILTVDVYPDLDEDGKPIEQDAEAIENGIHLNVHSIDMADAENGIDYKDMTGKLVHVDKEEVKLMRHVYENSFPVYFHVQNTGDARATGVRVKLSFPNELLVLSTEELLEYREEEPLRFSQDAYEGWNMRFESPNQSDTLNEDNKFIGIDELTTVDDIANLLDPAESNEAVSIFPGEVLYEREEVKHKDSDFFRGICILPTSAGKFKIGCDIICNEFPDSTHNEIVVEVS